MQTGLSLVDLAREVQRQQNAKRDFTVPAKLMEMEAEDPASPILHLGPDVDTGISRTGHEQLAQYVGIPHQYYERCLAAHPQALAEHVNLWLLDRGEESRLVRTLDDRTRALLSPRYRPLDHHDLLEAILPQTERLGLNVVSSQVTERRLYLQVLTPKLKGEVVPGDEVQRGLVISNSEVGFGAVRIDFLIYRLICSNGMVSGEKFRRNHVGRRTALDGEDVQEFYRDRTRILDDAAFFAKVRDTVDHMLDPAVFQAEVEKLREAAQSEKLPARNLEARVVEVSRKVGLTKGEGESALAHLIENGDLSQWGMANAVTRLANDLDDYDRAMELERAGGKVIELPRSEWKRLAEAA